MLFPKTVGRAFNALRLPIEGVEDGLALEAVNSLRVPQLVGPPSAMSLDSVSAVAGQRSIRDLISKVVSSRKNVSSPAEHPLTLSGTDIA